MRNWGIAFVSVLTCAAAVTLLVWAVATPRVTYNGRTVKAWAVQFYASGEQHEEAVAALQELGEKAVPELVRLLRKSDLPFRKQVCGALPGMPATVRPAILRAYGPPPYEFKIAAARALGVLGPKALDATSALRRRMRDRDPSVANEAALALAQASPECIRHFESALREPNPNARRAAAYALGGLGARAGPVVPDLVRALADTDSLVSLSAESSLWRIGAAAIPPLLEFIARDRGPMRERFADGLVRAYLGSPPVPRIATLLHDNPELQQARAESVGNIRLGGHDGVLSGLLAAMLNDPSPLVRLAAARSLHGVRSPKATIALMRRLKDENGGVRLEAARTLGTLGGAARPALFELRRLMVDEQEPVRRAAKEALAQIERAPQQ